MPTDPTVVPEPSRAGSLPPSEPADPTPVELGRRIKMLRVARDLTLKELEERGQISATHVSEIERGKASPTVGALARIAAALGVRPATLIGPRVLPECTIARASDSAGTSVRLGAAIIEPIAQGIHDAELGMYRVTLPIGRGPALEHHHEGEEWVTVLSGAVEIRIDDQSHALREGESLHFRAERPHAYTNPASTDAVLLIASRPRLAL